LEWYTNGITMSRLISVVIPLFNKVDWIERTVESVLNQDYDNFELIIVDNGSTDGSLEKIKAINDTRILILKEPKNGVSCARNLGLEHAKSDWVAFLDADDLWDARFLSTINRLIDSYSECVLFGTNYHFLHRKKTKKPNDRNFPKNEGIVSDYFRKMASGDMLFTASSVCVAKEKALELGGFPEGERIGEDQEMWIKLALSGSIVWTPIRLAYYRQGIVGMATLQAPDKEIWPFVKRLIERSKSDVYPKSLRKGFETYAARHLVGQASQLIITKDKISARKLLENSVAKKAGLRYWYWFLRSYLISK